MPARKDPRVDTLEALLIERTMTRLALHEAERAAAQGALQHQAEAVDATWVHAKHLADVEARIALLTRIRELV